MTTPRLERAFIDLAAKNSRTAQEVLRRWLATREIAMAEYQELADRLTVAYLERDTRRAASQGTREPVKPAPVPPKRTLTPKPVRAPDPPDPAPRGGSETMRGRKPIPDATRGHRPGWRGR